MPLAVRVAASWSWRLVAIGAGVYFLGRILGFFSAVLIPLLVAMLLAALLAPVVDSLVRVKVPRVLATTGVLLATVAVLVGLGGLVTAEFTSSAAGLTAQVNSGIQEVEDWLQDGPLDIGDDQLTSYTDQVQAQIETNATAIASSVLTVTSAATSLITGAFVVLFLLIFFLQDGRRIWEWCVRLLPQQAEAPFDGAVRRGWITLVSYVRATVVVAFVDALGIGIGAWALGVELFLPLAVITFAGAFVPFVGALLTGAVAVLVALVTVGPTSALILLVVVLGVQQLEANVLQPFLLGRAVSVHPVAVILAISAGIVLAGIPGALFAVPVVAVLNTVISYLAQGGDGGPLPEEAGENEASAPLEPDPVPKTSPLVDDVRSAGVESLTASEPARSAAGQLGGSTRTAHPPVSR